MTVADLRTAPPELAPAPSPPEPIPPDDRDAAASQLSGLVVCVAAALSTAAAAVALAGVFTGVGAKLLGVAVALVGPALVLLSSRTARPAVVQYLVLPVALGLGAVAALASGGTGSATLPTLVADAVRGGGLGQPPVPFAPGWRFLLVTLLVLLGAGAASLASGLSRPRLAVAAPAVVVVAAALVQPPASAVATCSIALVLLVAALTVAAGAHRDGDQGGSAGRGSFELLRLLRGAAGLVALAVVLVVVGSTGALLPKPRADQVVPPRPPKPSAPVADRVLFTVRTATAGDVGPWTTGVLDSYVGDTWLLPSYDRGRLRTVHDGQTLPDAPSGPAARRVRFTIGELAGSNVPSVDGAHSVEAGGLHLKFDPATQQLLSAGQQPPPGTTYAVDAAALPTAAQLEHAASPPASMASYLSAPPVPPEVARVLAADAGANRFDRLQAARTFLYQHVVAEGRGIPRPVPAQRVAEMFAGAHATPFEITAAEALLARWVGVPARIGFGYSGGVAGRDGRTFAVHPSNGAMWLQTWWPQVGWVSIVGRPAQAVTPTSLDQHQQAAGVRSNGQLALVVHVPVELASLRALFEDVRFYAAVTLPWLALLVLVVVFHPAAWKALRRRRRRRWAARRGPSARLLVAYADLRDRLRDLDARAANATPLEFCHAVAADDEHWELAWLVTRALWGDLARDLRDGDVDAAEEMARSVRQRVLRAQRLTARLGGAASRASLRDPWTRDVPNAWPTGRLRRSLRRAVRSWRPRLLLQRRAPVTAALVLLAALLLSGCAGAKATVATQLPARFVPQAVGPYALRESTTAEQAFVRAGPASLVTGGHVWTVVAPDGTVKGSVQAAVFKPSLRSRLHDVERGVRASIGSGDFTLTRVGTHAVYESNQSQEQLLLYFPPTGGYYELLDVRSDFSDAGRLLVALLDYQQGVQSRPVPPALDPRRGGDD